MVTAALLNVGQTVLCHSLALDPRGLGGILSSVAMRPRRAETRLVVMQHLKLKGIRCVLAAVVSTKDKSAPQRLDALQAELAAAGAIVVARIVQRYVVSRTRAGRGFKNSPAVMSPSTVLGSGKTRELVHAVRDNDATLVVFLNPLKSSQVARLADVARCEVVSAAPLA